MANEQASSINALIQLLRINNPDLADVLQKLADETSRIATVVDPEPIVPKRSQTPLEPAPEGVTVMSYSFTRTNVLLKWEAPSSGFFQYELRQGLLWETATRLFVTSNLIAVLDPMKTGTTRILLKTINLSGIYGTDTASVDIIVPPIGEFTVTPATINNFVELSWTVPAFTFAINFFTVYREGIVSVVDIRGTFIIIQERVGGIVKYGVQAQDIAGNVSPIMEVTLDVAKPADYDLQDFRKSDFTPGQCVITNGKLIQDITTSNIKKLYIPVNTTETIAQHFDTRTVSGHPWRSPADQILAGFPYWIQPTPPTAQYYEWFNFAPSSDPTLIYEDVIVGVSDTTESIIPPTVTKGVLIYTAIDPVADGWGTPYAGTTVFVPAMRWVLVVFNFSGAESKSLAAFYNFIVTLHVHRENDGGNTEVKPEDVSKPEGTFVEFGKKFKFVESITVTPQSTFNVQTAYDFDGGPNPLGFSVYMFNASGARVSGPFSWKARGIV